MKFSYFLFSLLLLLLLNGCGGDSGDSTTSTPSNQTAEETTTVTGLFLNSPVSGLHYTCFNGREGNTTTEGEFTCDINDTRIQFDIPQDGCCNDISLGYYIEIKDLITASDLSPDTTSVLHMLQLLQTLDKDKNASNGVEIDPVLVKKLNDEFIYFSAKDFDKRVESALEIPIVSPKIAYEHYKKSLQEKSLPELVVDHTRPLFTSVNSVTLYENHKDVIDINATDDNPITYKIEKATASFVIDAQTGELTFKSTGDYESARSYTVEISAYDGVNISYQTLTINLLDIDEDRPVINVPSSLNIDENQFFAFDINATDESPLTYTLSGTDVSYFDVNQSTGIVTFKTLSDYENGHSYSYYINVDVKDSLGNSSSRNVTLRLNPINDNAPVITSASNITLPENETQVLKVTTTDADNRIRWTEERSFSIKDSDSVLFDINSTTGILTFKTAPDYENDKHNYTLTLQASDANYTTSQTLNISITDVDDIAPIFTTDANVTVEENQLVVMQVSATDENTITYTLLSGDYYSFDINKISGIISFKNLTYANYERKSTLNFQVKASDGINISYQTVTVNLLDIDEDRPVINAPSILNIDENQFFAFDINATDESPLTYTLSGADASYFDANQSTGIVTFKTISDYENGHSPYYYMTVIVNDSLSNSSSRNIRLRLNPLNDNIPVVTVESLHNIYENTSNPTIPFSIADGDISNDTFKVSLIGDDASFFNVYSSASVGNKNINFKGIPDYETQKHSYSFQLKVQDGDYTIIKDIVVNILDIDENPPVLTLPKTLTIDENQIKILDVNATDENNLTYSVLGRTPYTSNVDTIFSIDDKGTLSWKIDPDYETSNSWKTYYADVKVSDGRNSVTKMITISLRNINDNAPVITSASDLTLPENETQVLRVTTTDADNTRGWTEEKSFSIKDGDSALFDMNSSTGVLSFKTSPDYEIDKHNYTLTIEASDTNFTTPQTLNINITDVDENAPIFTTTDINVTVEENQLAVMQVSATDENNITYRLQSGDSYSFDINKTSGVISFRNLTYADYERKSILNFQVRASDGLNTSTQDLTVNLTNLNDNTPTIYGSTTRNIYENSTNVSSYTISDADDDNITVTLNNSLFDYNATSKYLSFKNAPDYESDPHTYSVRLTASDGVYSSSLDITLNLLNRDDVVPTLNNFTASIDENTPIGTVVGTVSVANSGDSDILSYYISGTDYNYFRISSSGEITTNKDIDYESISTYNFIVKARNRAGYSNDKSVTININDIAEKDIPTLVVIMNWNDYTAGTASEWHNKIFNKSSNSVAKWYQESTNGELKFIPVTENSGTSNDGIIIVNMGINHPGGSNNTDFRDTHITNAITSSTVANSVDFAALDTNGNGDLDISEIQIIFIVAGGEESYGDPRSHSIWAHAWSFGSGSSLSVDGVTLMKYNGDKASSGSYSRFGANHGDHRATIGVITHELGHAMLSLRDFYDNGGGSGLGWYDVMSGGSWAQQDSDTYDGDTPTQFSTYNKKLAGLNMNIRNVNRSSTLTIDCSSNDAIKLTTSKTDEYFLIECRDTDKQNSDISMNNAYNGGFSPNDNASFANRLFSVVYHVDDTKTDNTEDGSQSSSYHYNIAVVEKETTHLMTSTANIEADYNDVLIEGETLDTTRTKLYDGTTTGYAIEITNADYSNKTMTIRITK